MKLSRNIKVLNLNDVSSIEDEKDPKINNKKIPTNNSNKHLKPSKRMTYISQKSFGINNNIFKSSIISRNSLRNSTNKPKNLNILKTHHNDPLLLLSEDSSSSRKEKNLTQKKILSQNKNIKRYFKSNNKIPSILFKTRISTDSNNNKKIPVPKNSFSFGKVNNNINHTLYSQYQKELYESVKLKNLKEEIHKFEISEKYQPDEKIIQENLSSPNTFINKKYLNKTGKFSLKVKDKNRYFENEDLVKSKLKSYLKNFSYSKYNFPKLKRFYKKINKIKTNFENFEFNFNNAKNNNYNYLRTNDVFREALSFEKPYTDEINEAFKIYTLDYKKKMGEFTFYNGKGIFSGHVSTLANGDRIVMSGLSQFQK